MKLRDTWFGMTAAAALLCAAGVAQAGSVNTLTFSGLGLSGGADVPQSYQGDAAANTSHVTVSYRAVDTTGTTQVHGSVGYFGTGYGDLSGIAYNAASKLTDAYLLEITLTAAAGYQVTLGGFDFAGVPSTYNPSYDADHSWPTANWTGQTLWILDGNGNDLFKDTNLTIHGVDGNGATHDSFTAGYTSGSIVIRLGTTYYVGIDNVAFSESLAQVSISSTAPAVPVPPAAALGFVGLGVAALVRRRRRPQPA